MVRSVTDVVLCRNTLVVRQNKGDYLDENTQYMYKKKRIRLPLVMPPAAIGLLPILMEIHGGAPLNVSLLYGTGAAI